jgi:ketosteroid isomerase-like protein
MQDLIDDLFVAIDRRDSEQFLRFIAPEARFRFGSAPPVVGHDAIREAVGGFFASIAELSHTLKRVVSSDSALLIEGEVTYTRHDSSEITLPFVNVLEIEDRRISDYKIYIDIGPLYAE